MKSFELKEAVRIIRQYGPFGVLSKLSKFVRLPLVLRGNRGLKDEQGLDALVDFGFSAFSGLIKPFQNKNEIRRLLQILDAQKPRTIVEIGTACGGNLFLLCRVAAADALVISVDLPGGVYGGGYPAWRIPIYRSSRCPANACALSGATLIMPGPSKRSKASWAQERGFPVHRRRPYLPRRESGFQPVRALGAGRRPYRLSRHP